MSTSTYVGSLVALLLVCAAVVESARIEPIPLRAAGGPTDEAPLLQAQAAPAPAGPEAAQAADVGAIATLAR
jgi:hypothetical protein